MTGFEPRTSGIGSIFRSTGYGPFSREKRSILTGNQNLAIKLEVKRHLVQ